MKIIHKDIGETSLEALESFRQLSGKSAERLSYAGRLDPMAAGKLLVLEGEENDQRSEFLGLDKTYEFSILFGASTDTFDLLGLVDEVTKSNHLPLTVNKIKETLRSFVGDWNMKYPPYSAKTVEVDGKMTPLWQIARAGRIKDIQLPTKEVSIYEADCSDVREVDRSYIIDYIIDYITKVSGDFRQEAIIKRWKEVLLDADQPLQLASCQVSGSAGLYVRRLAYEVGRQLTVPSLAFSITRTKIGNY